MNYALSSGHVVTLKEHLFVEDALILKACTDEAERFYTDLWVATLQVETPTGELLTLTADMFGRLLSELDGPTTVEWHDLACIACPEIALL